MELIKLIKLTRNAKGQSIKMQNRLLLYWAVMLFIVFAAILVALSFAGVFSDSEEKAAQLIKFQQKNTYAELSGKLEKFDGEEYFSAEELLNKPFFELRDSAIESEFGNMITAIAPIEYDELMVSKGIAGGIGETSFRDNENYIIKEGKNFNRYIGRDSSYIGLHQKFDINFEDGSELYAVTLLPEEIYLKEEKNDIFVWTTGTIVLFIGLLLISFFMAKKFVKPIMDSIENIKSEKTSGISEIDTLLAFIREKEKDKGKQKLTEDIEELFEEFSEKAKALTPTEKTIIKYYGEGREINEIPELCFISINTVRKHNANIYQKLEIGSREELLLYIELFRRSGRLDEIF